MCLVSRHNIECIETQTALRQLRTKIFGKKFATKSPKEMIAKRTAKLISIFVLCFEFPIFTFELKFSKMFMAHTKNKAQID